MAQMVKNLPTMWETRVPSQDGEDPLEKGMATHSSVLAWRIPWTEKPGRLQFVGSKRVDTTEQLTHTHTHTHTDLSLRHSSPLFPLPLCLVSQTLVSSEWLPSGLPPSATPFSSPGQARGYPFPCGFQNLPPCTSSQPLLTISPHAVAPG